MGVAHAKIQTEIKGLADPDDLDNATALVRIGQDQIRVVVGEPGDWRIARAAVRREQSVGLDPDILEVDVLADPRIEDVGSEIPSATKRRLGLDDQRSWVILTEANLFTWPEPDLRPTRRGEAASVLYGKMPANLLLMIRDAFIALQRKHKAIVTRTE